MFFLIVAVYKKALPTFPLGVRREKRIETIEESFVVEKTKEKDASVVTVDSTFSI